MAALTILFESSLKTKNMNVGLGQLFDLLEAFLHTTFHLNTTAGLRNSKLRRGSAVAWCGGMTFLLDIRNNPCFYMAKIFLERFAVNGLKLNSCTSKDPQCE